MISMEMILKIHENDLLLNHLDGLFALQLS